MSEPFQPDGHDYQDERFLSLVARYLDRVTTPSEEAMLAEELRHSEQRQLYFVEYCRHAAMLKELLSEQGPTAASPSVPSDVTVSEGRYTADNGTTPLMPTVGPPALPEGGTTVTPTDRSPILGFLGDVFRAGTDFLSRPPVLTLLLTIGLPGILLVLLLVHIGSQPVSELPVAGRFVQRMAVAQVTRTHECVWAEDGTLLDTGVSLVAGQQLRLNKGLVELIFADGAKVLLKGPATFDTSNAGAGYLHTGSLVANVPKGSEGFTIQTPAAAVVDLGTEFGVRVEGETGTAKVEVFQGKVELRANAADRDPQKLFRHRVEAGQAVQVEAAEHEGAPLVVHKIALRTDQFVRQMPAKTALSVADDQARKVSVVADFSGGNGRLQVDQFPGKTGKGWMDVWKLGQRNGRFNVTATADHPMGDAAGNCLKCKFRGTKAKKGGHCGGMFREYAYDSKGNPDGIDVTKPHTIQYRLRIDEPLSTFTRFSDRYVLVGTSDGSAKSHQCDSFIIMAFGDGKDAGKQKIPKEAEGHWMVYNGNRGGSKMDWRRFVDTGIPLAEGRVYDFTITIDPATKSWNVLISDGVGEPFARMNLGWRTPHDTPGRYLSFGVVVDSEGDAREFSLDSVRITQTGPQSKGKP